MSVAMNEQRTTPNWLKIVAGLGVVWYAFGLLQFWLGVSLDTGAAVASGVMSQAHAAAVAGTPLFIWAAFALASFTGLVGAVSLFNSNTRAKTIFTVSITSALVYYGWVYGLSGTGGDRPSEEINIALVVLGVTAGFTYLSYRLAQR